MAALEVINVKSVRFTQIVEAAGKPEPYTLWQDPDEDAGFQKAIRELRVMTVVREPASSKADAALVGYLKKSGALYLVFPKTLEKFKDKRFVGLKYDLLTEPKPRGRPVKPGKQKKPVLRPVPPPRVKIQKPKTEPLPEPEPAPRQEPPKPVPKFRVRASVVLTVEKEVEIEAANERAARRDALKLLQNEPVDVSAATRKVKVTKVSKTNHERSIRYLLMDFFGWLSIMVAAGLLAAGFLRHRIRDMERYQSALALFVAALILYFPVSGLFHIGIYLGFVARPLGFVLEVMSLRQLCLALSVQARE